MVERIQRKLETPPIDLSALVAQLRASPQSDWMKWIKAAVGKQVKLIPVSDVVYLPVGHQIHARRAGAQRGADPHAVEGSPGRTRSAEVLAGASTQIVNLDAVTGVLREDAERQFVLLKNRQEKLPISRQFTHLFKQM